jgi:hypothetical protein
VNIVQCLSHSIEERDMLDLYRRIGVDAFSVGGYIDPRSPHDPKRPSVDSPFYPDLKAAVDAIGAPDNLGAAQARLPEALLDWADVIVYHHNLYRLFGQWPRIRRWLDEGSHRRVIWRSVGQSVTQTELEAAPYMADGLERVLYSPKERNIPGFSGGDASVIRFGKDPAEWSGWTGEDAVVLNIAQHDAIPHARDEWLNWAFWEEATRGLPVMPRVPLYGHPARLVHARAHRGDDDGYPGRVDRPGVDAYLPVRTGAVRGRRHRRRLARQRDAADHRRRRLGVQRYGAGEPGAPGALGEPR